ncbi:hypothetical protein C8R41DRAFT_118780 [Lentinula lateritia]|uniref:Uncharacterized protein n=1 Tax=Lentinula lateritia TaxID=40482 RepID=A0ABQ8VQE5_9AGAR|nr:hypothetical protein C8R41DRAFT_118780 [Lentinula lateritia]
MSNVGIPLWETMHSHFMSFHIDSHYIIPCFEMIAAYRSLVYIFIISYHLEHMDSL